MLYCAYAWGLGWLTELVWDMSEQSYGFTVYLRSLQSCIFCIERITKQDSQGDTADWKLSSGGSPSLASLPCAASRKEENGVLGIPFAFPLAHASLYTRRRSEPAPVNRLVIPIFGVPGETLL
ncbi:hypothetical protein TNCV_192731 [Trichonephila clavipes]|nr:hypothetical protein TNCV_192731 [Trichonephila clavipes]